MSSIPEVVAQIRQAMSDANEASRHVQRANQEVEKASASFAAATEGTAIDLPGEALASLGKARVVAEEALTLYAAGSATFERYIGILRGEVGGSSAPPPVAASRTSVKSQPTGPKEINGRTYTKHAQQQMTDPTRNVSPEEVEHVIRHGKSHAGRQPGTTDYYDVLLKVHVVVNVAGNIVTARRQSRLPRWAR